MTAIISLEHIDRTISNLNYRSATSMKSRLVQAIRQFYVDESSDSTLEAIQSVSLIDCLWDTGGDPRRVNKKRKNLNSVRSSINVDLQNLFKAGGNPDGITISPDNVFVMSDEAKDKALNSLLAKIPGDAPASLDQISEVLNVISEALSNPQDALPDEPTARLQKLAELKKLVQGLSDKIDITEAGLGGGGLTTGELSHGDDMGAPGGNETAGSQGGEKTAGSGDAEGSTNGGTGDSGHTTGPDNGSLQADEIEAGGDNVTDIIELDDDDDDVEDIEEVDLLEEVDIEDALDGGDGDGDGEKGAGIGARGGDKNGGNGDTGGAAGDASGSDADSAGLDDASPQMDADDDLETVEFEGDLEEVDLLEEVDIEDITDEDEIESIDDLSVQGEDKTGNLGGDGGLEDEASGGAGVVDNHLDAIESGHDFSTPADSQKARLLAETFNRSLAAMDKFFNQYIEFAGGQYIVGAKHPKKGEISKHLVTLATFYMGKFPVTNALFEVFVENTGYISTAEKLGYGTVYEGRSQTITDPHTHHDKHIWRANIVSKTVERAYWYQPIGPGSTIHQKRNHPVVQVSVHDAMAFSAWTGKRLPSEEEWEAASRTAVGHLFPWGNVMQPEACNFEGSNIGDTTPVDSYPDFENEAGIADTLGNVHEWASSLVPTGLNTDQSSNYVIKGGSWLSNNNPRLYSRLQLAPESHSNILGFRCVAS